MTSRPMNLLNSLRICGLCAALAMLSACNNDGSAAQVKDAKPAASAVPVEVAKAARGSISASYSGTAALVADHEAQVTSKASGMLMKLFVEEGMTVKKGQLLAELDDAPQPQSSRRPRRTMKKADAHSTSRTIDQEEPDPARRLRSATTSTCSNAARRVAGAQARSVVHAHRCADLRRDRRTLGQARQSGPGQPELFQIVDMDPLQAVLNVPERELGIAEDRPARAPRSRCAAGQKFDRHHPAHRAGRRCDQRHVPRRPANSTTRPGRSSPACSAASTIVYDQRHDALVVPRSALVEEDGETAVFVIDKAPPPANADKTPSPMPKALAKPSPPKDAKPAASSSPSHSARAGQDRLHRRRSVEIRAGLEDGERVITIGRNAVRDGTEVQVLIRTSTRTRQGAGCAKLAGAQG